MGRGEAQRCDPACYLKETVGASQRGAAAPLSTQRLGRLRNPFREKAHGVALEGSHGKLKSPWGPNHATPRGEELLAFGKALLPTLARP